MENDHDELLSEKFQYDEEMAMAKKLREEQEDQSPDYDSSFYIGE